MRKDVWKRMKRLINLFALTLMCFFLCACGDNADISETLESDLEEQAQVKEEAYSFVPLENTENLEVIGLLYSVNSITMGNNWYEVIENGLYLAKSGSKYGLLDTEGNWVCPPEYMQISYWYDYYLEKDFSENSAKYSLNQDKEVYKLEEPYIVTGTLSDPMAVWDCNSNRLMLTYGGDASIQDPNFEYNGTIPVHQVSCDENLSYYYGTENDLRSAICTNGELQTGFVYERATTFSDGLIAVRKNNKWGYANSTGNLIIPCEYDAIRNAEPVKGDAEWDFAASCTEGYVVLSKEGKYALADASGEIVIPFGEYDVLTEVQNNSLYAKKDNVWGIISLKDEMKQ